MKTKKYFVELESLRGLAALLVTIYHVKYWKAVSGLPNINQFIYFVDFFFLLSGFVIALNFSKSIDSLDTLKKYLVKRIFRLYPLFIITSVPWILISIGKAYLGMNQFKSVNSFTFFDFATYITLIYKWGFVEATIFNYPAWSISVEWLLYILVGFLFLFKLTPKANTIISAILCIISFGILFHYAGMLGITGRLALFRGILSFFLGVIVYNLYNRKAEYQAVSGAAKWITFIVSLILLIIGFTLAGVSKLYSFGFPVLWAFIIYAIITEKYPPLIFKIFNLKWIVYLGTISYSMYMVHPIVLVSIEKLVGKARLESNMAIAACCLILYVGLIILLSAFTYRFIEIPGKDLYKYKVKKAI